MPYGRLAKHEIPSSCLPLLPLNYYSSASLLIFDKDQLRFVFSESEQTIPAACHTRHNSPMDLCFTEHCMMKRLFVYYSNRQGVASKQRDISVISHSVAASCKRA